MSEQITITLRPLSSKEINKEIKVLKNDIVSTKVAEILSLLGYSEDQQIKIIFSGKVIKEYKTFAENGLDKNNFVIIMKETKKTKALAPVLTSTSSIQVQTPLPVIPVVPPTFWNTQPTQADTATLFSFEQVYSVLPHFYKHVLNSTLNNPQLEMEFENRNMNPIFAEATNARYINFLRQLLQQSTQIVADQRAGRVSQISLTINEETREFSPYLPISALPLALPPLNEDGGVSLQQFVNFLSGIGMNGNGAGLPAGLPAGLQPQAVQVISNTATTAFTPQDEESIQNIMVITGGSRKVVLSVYLMCGKNADATCEMIYSMLDGQEEDNGY
jgi:hypothetical protein